MLSEIQDPVACTTKGWAGIEFCQMKQATMAPAQSPKARANKTSRDVRHTMPAQASGNQHRTGGGGCVGVYRKSLRAARFLCWRCAGVFGSESRHQEREGAAMCFVVFFFLEFGEKNVLYNSTKGVQ